MVARWSSVALCVTMFAFVAFTIVREHGGRFLSSGMSLWRMGRPRASAYVPTFVFALYVTVRLSLILYFLESLSVNNIVS